MTHSTSAPTLVATPSATRREAVLDRADGELRALLFEERKAWLFRLQHQLKHDHRLVWKPRVGEDDEGTRAWLWLYVHEHSDAVALFKELAVPAFEAGIRVEAAPSVETQVPADLGLVQWRLGLEVSR